MKDPEYAGAYGMSLAQWMIYHQREIALRQVRWMGIETLKNPLDCWIYQEILWEVRPDVLVELGSHAGGSTMYFCHLFDLLGHGQVVSVDCDRSCYQAKHPRIVEITGDCSALEVVAQVADACAGKTVLAVHDADHRREAVLRDLRLYADLVTLGSYFIVEDGVVDVFHAHASPELGWKRAGPLAATRDFLREDDRFAVDESRERYLITYNPRGFLKRVR